MYTRSVLRGRLRPIDCERGGAGRVLCGSLGGLLLSRPSLSWLRGVAELRVLKDGADPVGPLGEATHMADRCALQLLLAPRRRPAWDRLLEVGVQPLVRVQVGAIRRQVVHLDPGAVLGEPVLNQTGAVHPQPVENEEDLAAGLPDQALEEADQGRSLDRTVDDHPAQLAFVGHRRDQAQAGSLVTDPTQRCPATRRVAAAAHVVRAQSGLVAPEDDGTGLPGPR